MNIIGLTNQTSGCGYHRVILPLAFMQDIKGIVSNGIVEEMGKDWNIILYNRVSIYDKDLDYLRELFNCKIVLDLDDYWRLPPNHVLYEQYENNSLRIESNIRNADLVTVTNKSIYDKVKLLTDRVMIFENALPFGENQFTPERREDARVRIFWAGSITHEQDLKILRNPITKIKVHADKIKMVIGGYNDSDEYTHLIWKRMFSAFTAGGSLPYMKLHNTSPISYMQMYENADIMLIPLEDSDWHACKSNLKILEAACKKIPCIVSNVAPYNQDKDCPVFWVNNQKDWFYHLNYLILNPTAREEAGNKLYEWAKEKYNLTDINQRRRSVFSDLCKAPALLPVLSTDG